MRTSYHVTPNGPRPCEATQIDCRYGSHFDNLKDANEDYARTMRETFGEFSKVSKSFAQKRRENAYQAREKFITAVKATKASKAAQQTAKAVKQVRNGAESVALVSMYGAEAVASAAESTALGALIARDAIKAFPRKAQAYASKRGNEILRYASKKIEETPEQIAAKKQELAASAARGRARMGAYVREISGETKKRIRDYRENLKKIVQKQMQEQNERAEGSAKRTAKAEKVQPKDRNAKNSQDARRNLRSSYREAVGKAYGGALKARFASDLRTGDYLPNGQRVMQVSNVNGSTRVTVMDPQSKISRTDILDENSLVASVRPRRRAARELTGRATRASKHAWRSSTSTLARGAKAMSAGAMRASVWYELQKGRGASAWKETKKRVRAASAHQRESFDALRGIDRSMIVKSEELATLNEVEELRSVHHLRKVA